MLLARDEELVAEVNRWLGELEIGYRLSVEPVAGEKLGVELGDLLATTLHDTRSGLSVTPQDVGFGISQLLPVVVQLLVGQRRTVCVEQPEIHIHPRLQAKVGDLLLAATAPRRGNQVIVETHSEHLMLRLQRRLRERRYQWLTPAHIKVLYIDIDSAGQATSQELRLDEDGHFIDEWPHGFFSERVDELFSSAVNPPRRLTRRPERP
jgi:predicted ATPase